MPLLYVLHSGNLYGTERMALATIAGMNSTYNPLLLAPPGPVHAEARRLETPSRAFASVREFALLLRSRLAQCQALAFVATGVAHSLTLLVLNMAYRRPVAHLHIVHGGAEEAVSYGRKRWLNRASVAFVAVSAFVKERLLAHGVRSDRVTVIENFLPTNHSTAAPRRAPFSTAGVKRVLVVSRLDPIKRVDVLLDALELAPDLHSLSIRVLGSGREAERLRERAARSHPNVTFVGFSEVVREELAAADLLLHLCPVEPFGLAILEAMAVGTPVLAPDTGGAATLIEEGISGFHFRANDAADLARRLRKLCTLAPKRLNAVVAEGDKALATRFSASERIADYRRLIQQQLALSAPGRSRH
jgi:glycosyltransferase involved in cell wall biosynthesis